ncbi:hypothetical protein FD754_015191 [Muntiacus muntjak]|uniref:Phosphorylase b kinase regulatory subunit n=1 Tax=Muntiacus muntjak TaxID=9888 RepID=A0A5N3VMJ7_MUNMU|nr:hypothetical protein FD754_015191 [Muntiacus muntjak]
MTPSPAPINYRFSSVYEPLKSINLPRSDETLWDKLDHYYRIVKSTLLLYQSPTTGLFPTKTCGDDQKAKIHDSLYCAAGAWALALAYRRIDDDKGRTHELEHSAIKCMRGILYCYMRQADKVQQFKQDPRPTTCLHSVFNVHTGDEILSYEEYGHLQVSFIQNLVFCVERVYRVPDFGVWERGSKYNNGSTELHSSYPAFALDDEVLFSQTLDKVIRKLKGKYGFKRFLRDGYRTSLEDPNRRYYKPAEIKLFDGIECEFPIFFLYMMIDGVFRGNPKQVKEYQDLLTPVLHHTTEGYPVIPKYYYVPADFVEHEKRNPGSQKRFPSNCGRDGKLFLWGQALYIIAKLLGNSDLHICVLQAYFHLGINEKLGLCGRPDRPIGCLGTSKIYRILGKTVVCYPIIFDLSDFYMSQDVLLLIDDIKNALQFIKQYWKMHGRPLFLVLIREDNIKGSRFNPILDMLAAFKKGMVGGVKVHVDRLQTLISGAVVEQLDFLRISEIEELPEFKSFEELEVPKHSKVKRQSSTSNVPEQEQKPDVTITEWRNKPTHEILQKLNDCSCLASQTILLGILLKREGLHFITKEGTVSDHIERVYRRAGSKKLWSVVRHAASLLSKLVDSLAPSITNVLVQGKQVTLGAFGHEEEVISNPLSPGVIKNIIYYKCNTHDEREAVIQQELVIHIGWIISNNPELFSGMLKIRIGCWLNRRQIDGSLNRTPPGFYDRVWQILERTPDGIIVAGRHLPQQPTLSDMTMYEMNFSLLVEDMLGNIDQPKYRQIVVELLMVVSIVLERNPELEFQDKVDLDKLVKEAFHEFQKDESRLKEVEKQDDMTSFYNTPPLGKRGTCSYLTKVVMNRLLEGEVKPSNDDPCLVS